MTDISRREFIARASAAAGAAMVAGGARADQSETKKVTAGSDVITLGDSGVESSLLGMGTGSHGWGRASNQTRLGEEKFFALVRHAVDRGIRYFDTADQYGSHFYLRRALKGVPREKLFIQTKTRAVHPEVARADIDRFRQELGIDVIDSVLMHCMQSGDWPKDMRPVMDVLSEAKEKGRVRAVGVSCHGMDPLKASVGVDWIDIQLARINPFGMSMDGKPEEVVPHLKSLHKAGKGVIGMKICANGKRTTAEDRLQSLKYALNLGCLHSIVVGFETPKQIDEVLDQIAAVLKEKTV